MNWQHLQAFLWLRWRTMVNQWRRGGAFNGVLMIIVTVSALIFAIPLFIGCLALGIWAIPQGQPVHLLIAWDILLAAYLLSWSVGVVIDLQRAEPLSLSKFMHLPVSVNGAFLINYFSSLFRLSMLIFAPVMLAFCLALIYTKGAMLLVALPLLAAFLLMVTALTYQLQGWLAALMSNPRRRRNVVVGITGGVILISQLPNLLQFWVFHGAMRPPTQIATDVKEMTELTQALQSQQIDLPEYQRRIEEVKKKQQSAIQSANASRMAEVERTVTLVNLALPVGWLPLGVKYAADGQILPSILGLLGMTLIGSASLWRAFRTTIGIYQGQATNRKGRPAPKLVSHASERKPGGLLLEASLPGFSEPVSAIALASFRSIIRAPETKMMLLTPLIMGAIFGSMIFRQRQSLPEASRPWIAIGMMTFLLLGFLQQMANQFGFDRDGFRVFVLCSAPRRDILLGKNLGFAPVALGMGAFLLVVLEVLCPLRLDHLAAMIPQFLSMFLLCCLFTNLMSIYSPVHVAAGALKPSNLKLSTALLQLVMFMGLFPLTQGVTLLPLGIEAILQYLDWPARAPIYLVLSLLECVVVVFVYRLILSWQGSLFQAREQKILEVVTNRAA